MEKPCPGCAKLKMLLSLILDQLGVEVIEKRCETRVCSYGYWPDGDECSECHGTGVLLELKPKHPRDQRGKTFMRVHGTPPPDYPIDL